MSARSRERGVAPVLPAGLIAVAILAACAEVPPPQTPEHVEELRSEWESAVDAEPSTEEAAAAAPPLDVPYTIEAVPEPEAGAAEPGRAPGSTQVESDDTVVRIATAERERQPRTLWEASVAARADRRRDAPRARISIRDDNLHEFQDGSVTIGGTEESAEEPAGEGRRGDEVATDAGGDEEYWRSTVLDLRVRLRAAVDELAELDGRATDLRRSFYAADDPFVRDGEIKPAWDRTLDRIEEARREILTLSRELDVVLEEGRRAGALPGWLREGADLEPEPDELPTERGRTEHEAGEPEVLEIEEQNPPDERWEGE